MKEQPSKEERKRLLIEMLNDKSDELDREAKSHQVTNTEQLLVNAGASTPNNMEENKTQLRSAEEDQRAHHVREAVKNDPVAMWTSDDDLLLYEHFFHRGIEYASQFKPSGVKTLTEQEFCQMYSSCYGEEIDKVQQLRQANFTGEELMEFVDHCFQTRNNQTTL